MDDAGLPRAAQSILTVPWPKVEMTCHIMIASLNNYE